MLRQPIAEAAANEHRLFGTDVHAKSPGDEELNTSRTFRQGYDRLLEYFRVAAPDPNHPDSTYFRGEAVRYLKTPGKLAPMPHLCGIFSLWAVKTALTPMGVSAGNWRMGLGLDREYFKTTTQPQKGDIAYKDKRNNKPVQHHAVVYDVYVDEDGQTLIETIDGNSGATSSITRNMKPITDWDLFLTLKSLNP